MKYELIYKNNSQRFYKLEKPITKTAMSIFNLKSEFDDICKRVNKKYKLLTSYENGIDIICISDAITHIERLVFPAVKVLNTETNEEFYVRGSSLHIAGHNTFMISAGNSKSVHNDSVYIRLLSILNTEVKEG